MMSTRETSSELDVHLRVAQISRMDAPIPTWAERVVRFLDDGMKLPGTSIRIGADALLGFFVPGVGDAASAAMSASLFVLALQRRVPTIVLARMLLNVFVDTLFGSIPILGDVFDVFFKSNRKNLILLQRHNEPTASRANLVHYLVLGLAALILVASVVAPVLTFWWLLQHL